MSLNNALPVVSSATAMGTTPPPQAGPQLLAQPNQSLHNALQQQQQRSGGHDTPFGKSPFGKSPFGQSPPTTLNLGLLPSAAPNTAANVASGLLSSSQNILVNSTPAIISGGGGGGVAVQRGPQHPSFDSTAAFAGAAFGAMGGGLSAPPRSQLTSASHQTLNIASPTPAAAPQTQSPSGVNTGGSGALTRTTSYMASPPHGGGGLSLAPLPTGSYGGLMGGTTNPHLVNLGGLGPLGDGVTANSNNNKGPDTPLATTTNTFRNASFGLNSSSTVTTHVVQLNNPPAQQPQAIRNTSFGTSPSTTHQNVSAILTAGGSSALSPPHAVIGNYLASQDSVLSPNNVVGGGGTKYLLQHHQRSSNDLLLSQSSNNNHNIYNIVPTNAAANSSKANTVKSLSSPLSLENMSLQQQQQQHLQDVRGSFGSGATLPPPPPTTNDGNKLQTPTNTSNKNHAGRSVAFSSSPSVTGQFNNNNNNNKQYYSNYERSSGEVGGVNQSAYDAGLENQNNNNMLMMRNHNSYSTAAITGSGGSPSQEITQQQQMVHSAANDVILQQLPTSPLLYVLVTSEGRDKAFKLLQYMIKLMISILNLKGVIPNQMESASEYWSRRLAQNVQTVRNGRSMFKLGRWLVTCLHLKTAMERLRSKRIHEEAIAQLTEEAIFQRQRDAYVKEGNEHGIDFGLAIEADKEAAAAAGLVASTPSLAYTSSHHNNANNNNNNGGHGTPCSSSATPVSSCAMCVAAAANNNNKSSKRSVPPSPSKASSSSRTNSPAIGPSLLLPSASTPTRTAASSLATTPTNQSNAARHGVAERQFLADHGVGVGSKVSTPSCSTRVNLSTSAGPKGEPSDEEAEEDVDEEEEEEEGSSSKEDDEEYLSGSHSTSTCNRHRREGGGVAPNTATATAINTPHMSPAAAAAASAIMAIHEQQNQNLNNLHPTCYAGGRVVRFSNSYQFAVFQPPEDSQCSNWRKSIVDFPRWGMYLLIIRCVTSIIRNLFRDCLYMGEKALFGFSRTKTDEINTLWNTIRLGRRNSLQIVADLAWLVMSSIDLFLNTRRLLQKSWITPALSWDTDFYCQCNLKIDVDDGEVIWAHVDPNFTRKMEEVTYPKLDFDFGSVTPTSAKFWEAAAPVTMKPCCTRCGCLLQRVPKGDEVVLKDSDDVSNKKKRNKSSGGNNNNSGEDNSYTSTSDEGTEQEEDQRQVMMFPYVVRKFLNVVSCARNNDNLRHTLMLQLRYVCDVYLAYGFAFGGEQMKSLPADKKYLQHVSMRQAVAGIISSYVALQRVLQSAN